VNISPAWRVFLTFNAAFWGSAFILFAMQANLLEAGEQWSLSLRRGVMVAVGFALTTGAHAAFERFGAGFSQRLRWCAATLPFLAAVCAAGFYGVYHVWTPSAALPPIALASGTTFSTYVVENYPYHLVLWTGWVGLYLTLAYAQALSARDRRLMEVAAQAHQAELKMLRYQINPHFLFNALNAISAQVLTGHAHEAEEMLTALSRFLRHSLAHSDANKASLAEELTTQRMYLSIERARFRERLDVHFEIEAGLEEALVPNFLLQPITENAMKHAVQRVGRTVKVTIAAARVEERLVLVVEDDGPPPAAADASGLGAGLANVRARLTRLYGAAASMKVGPRQGGGYRAEIHLPLEFEQMERAA